MQRPQFVPGAEWVETKEGVGTSEVFYFCRKHNLMLISTFLLVKGKKWAICEDCLEELHPNIEGELRMKPALALPASTQQSTADRFFHGSRPREGHKWKCQGCNEEFETYQDLYGHKEDCEIIAMMGDGYRPPS